MFSLLSNTLNTCRQPGTKAQGSGITVSTQPLAGETIIFFEIDCREGRQSLRMVGEGISICDHLIFYTKDGEHYETVCFLELKGTDLNVAMKQVQTTRKYVEVLSDKNIPKKKHRYFLWKICICLRSHAPSVSQRVRDELKQKYGNENVEIKHGITRYDIGQFLRRKPNE